MADRSVVVRLGANVAPYVAGMKAATGATNALGASTLAANTRLGAAGKQATATGAAFAGKATQVKTATASMLGMSPATLTVVGSVALLGKTLVTAQKAAIAFDAEITKLSTQVGLTAAEIEKAEAAIFGLTSTGVGMQELAEAMFFVQSAGLRGADAMQALEFSAKATSIGLGETKVVADLLTSAMNAYGPSVLGAEEATDILLATVREGKAEASELGSAMGTVLPVAAAMKVSLNDVGGVLAIMTRNGTNAARAGTGLRAMLLGILNPADQAREALRSVGLTFEELQETIEKEGLGAAMVQLNDALDGNAAVLAKVFPETRAYTVAQTLLGEQLNENIELLGRMGDTTNLTANAFLEYSQTTKGQLDQTRSDWSRAMVAMGQSSEGFAAVSVSALRKTVTSFADGMEAMANSVQALGNRVTGASSALETLNTAMAGMSQTQRNQFMASEEYALMLKNVRDEATRLYTQERRSLSLAQLSVSLLTINTSKNQDYMATVEALNKLKSRDNDTQAEGIRLLNALIAARQRELGLVPDSADAKFFAAGAAIAEAKAIEELARELTDAEAEAVGLTSAQYSLGTAMDEATQKIAGQIDYLRRAVDPAYNLMRSYEDMVGAQEKVNEAVAKYGADSTEATMATLGLIQNQLGLEQAARTLAETFDTDLINSFVGMLESAGVSADVIDGVKRNIEETAAAAGHPITFDVQTGDAVAAVQDFAHKSRAAMDDLATQPKPRVDVDIDPADRKFQDLKAMQDAAIVPTMGKHDVDASGAIAPLTSVKSLHDSLNGRSTSSTHTVTTITQTTTTTRASGGPLEAGQVSWVGEEGPELFVSSTAGQVIPSHQTTSFLQDMSEQPTVYQTATAGSAPGGGNSWRIVLNMPPGSSGKDVVSALRRFQRENGSVPGVAAPAPLPC